VIYPSIGNFTLIKKIYTIGGQKGANRPPEPKNGIWSPKSIWSCDISIEQEFYMEQEKRTFGVKKAKIGPGAQKRNLGSKIIWLCDISIDREFYME
jgi:hypothetical protein